MTIASTSLASRASATLEIACIDDKLQSVQQLAFDYHLGKLETNNELHVPASKPGVPIALKSVHPSKVERRRIGTEKGRLALRHAIAHIEFSAINLALDAIQRFAGMPGEYYMDWLKVACEECYHFSLLRYELNTMGHEYGDLPVHQGLWDVAQYSSDDILKRMALVPRVLEARGLDVTPGMIERAKEVGDTGLVEILKIILRDEVGHVATGSRWFNYICHKRGLSSAQTFFQIVKQYKQDMQAHIKGPFEREIRLAAGFSTLELEQLSV